MPKFINILAASVGGGILLGVGVRLGEAIAGRDRSATRDPAAGGRLEARLEVLEDRLVNLEAVGSPVPGDGDTKVEKQAAAAAAIRSELSREDERVAALAQIGAQLRVELQGWLEHSVGSRMADVEAKLRAESDDARRQMLDTFAESVQTRVTQRISRLEEEVGSQSAAMVELRDCSLRTEQSLQKLLGGLDRLLVPRPAPPLADLSRGEKDEEVIGQPDEPASDSPRTGLRPETGRAPESTAEESLSGPAAPEALARPRRWNLFG